MTTKKSTVIPLLGVSKGSESMTSTVERRSELYRRRVHPTSARTLWTITNLLTISRVLMVPVFFAYYINDVPRWAGGGPWSPTIAATIFLLASLTDWLDGYLARTMQLVSPFGAFLDPVADKIMVATALILLCVRPPAPVSSTAMALPVSMMICREISMSALREWAASSSPAAHKAVKVNSLGKWKTVLQMTSMTILLFLRDMPRKFMLLVSRFVDPTTLGRVSVMAFWASTALSLYSFSFYFANAWEHFLVAENMSHKNNSPVNKTPAKSPARERSPAKTLARRSTSKSSRRK